MRSNLSFLLSVCFDRRARQPILSKFRRKRERNQFQIDMIEAKPREREFNFARDCLRHRAATGIEIRDVDDPDCCAVSGCAKCEFACPRLACRSRRITDEVVAVTRLFEDNTGRRLRIWLMDLCSLRRCGGGYGSPAA